LANNKPPQKVHFERSCHGQVGAKLPVPGTKHRHRALPKRSDRKNIEMNPLVSRFRPLFEWLLRLAAGSVFLGRAWQHLFWDAPFTELLWDQGWMESLVGYGGFASWDAYVRAVDDRTVQHVTVGFGWFYLCCAVASLLLRRQSRWSRVWMWAGASGLACLALLYMKEHFFHVGQLFEYSLQVAAPLALGYAVVSENGLGRKSSLYLRMAISLTFICHGLYAVGYYPVPGSFMSMTIRILGMSKEGALQFLQVAGWLDFAVGVGVFLPPAFRRWVLWYAAGWGLATAMARIFGNMYWPDLAGSLHQWFFETVYRLPHGVLPLLLALDAGIRSKGPSREA
jgi:hypothetical protein